MKKVPILRSVIAFIISPVLVLSMSGMTRKPPEPPYAPGEILVKFHEDVSSERAAQIVGEEGGTVETILGSSGVYKVILPEGTDVMEAVKRFSALPEIRYAEPNYRAKPLEEK